MLGANPKPEEAAVPEAKRVRVIFQEYHEEYKKVEPSIAGHTHALFNILLDAVIPPTVQALEHLESRIEALEKEANH
jgi:hypothetical protein